MILLGSAVGGARWFFGRHHVHTFQVGGSMSRVATDATDTLLAVSFNSSGRNDDTSTPAEQAAQVWGLDDKQLRYTILDYPCPSGALAFHPTRAELVVGYHNGAVVEWDMTTGTQRRQIQPAQPRATDGYADSCTSPRATGQSIVDIVVLTRWHTDSSALVG